MGGAVAPLVIRHASQDPRFQDHPGLKLHGIESYIAVPLVRRDGSYFGTLCALDPEPSELGPEHVDVLQLLASLIAFELEAADERVRSAAELADAQLIARGRERLIAVLGHDLRSPLSAILGATSLLLRTPSMPDAAQRRVGFIVRSAERMGRMVDDILDFARGRLGGGIPIEAVPADLATLAQQVVDETSFGHPARTITLRCEGDTRGFWDEARLAQALANLVGNAVRYSSADTPIEVAVSRVGDAVEVRVHNQGPPIPERVAAVIFDPFRRGPRQGSAELANGLGLGLYIVEQIVSAHGGEVGVSSTAESGTNFWWVIPTVPAPSIATLTPA